MSEKNNPESQKFDSEVSEATDRIIRGFGPRKMGATILGWQDTEYEPGKRIEARQFQIDAWNAIADHRALGNHEALLYMATGLGKTTVVAGDIANFTDERRMDGKPAPRVLFLAHQIPLLDQAQERLGTLLPDLSSTLMKAGTVVNRDADITFATLQSMSNQKEEYTPDYFSYVIVDESHHAMASSFLQTIKYFKPEFRLGVTATPFRTDEQNLAGMFGETVYTKTLVDAIAEELLVSPSYTIVSDEIVRNAISSDFASLKDLNTAVFHERRNSEIARIIREAQDEIKDSRAIIFTGSISYAEEIAKLLPGAKTFHSGMNEEDQVKNLTDFRSGELSTIVTVDKFNEGVDVPEANLAVFLRSTGSRTVFEQQLGRVLRPSDGKEKTHVLDFVGTAERLKMLYDLSQDIKQRRHSAVSTETPDIKRDTETHPPVPQNTLGELEPNFTQEQIDIIKALKELEYRRETLKDFVSIEALAKQLNIHRSVIHSTARGLGIVGTKVPGGMGDITLFSPDEVVLIAESINSVERKPEGYMSTFEIFSTYNQSQSVIENAIKRLGESIMGKRARGKTGVTIYYSPEDVEKIINEISQAPTAPAGYVTNIQLANYLGVSPKVINGSARRLQIGQIMRAPNIAKGLFFSPNEQQQIIDDYAAVMPAPEGFLTADSAAKSIQAGRTLVVNTASRLGIDGHKMRGRTGVDTYFSPEEISSIAKEINKTPVAPDGFVSHGLLAKNLSTHEATLRKIVDNLGITGTRMRPSGKGREGIFYSAEEQERIEKHLRNRDK